MWIGREVGAEAAHPGVDERGCGPEEVRAIPLGCLKGEEARLIGRCAEGDGFRNSEDGDEGEEKEAVEPECIGGGSVRIREEEREVEPLSVWWRGEAVDC